MSSGTTNDALINNFQKACIEGNLRGVLRALTGDKLSAEELDNGLRLATKEAHPDIVAALFDAGVPMSPNAIGCLCGHDARQDPRVIRLYFDHGLKSRDCITPRGEPLLRQAFSQLSFISIGRLICGKYRFLTADCARELLERGVDPNRCGPRKTSPIASSLDLVHEDNGATFDLLVQYGAKVDSSLWFSALAWATDTEIKARFLLSRGLDPTTATSEKWGTPLHVAALFADKEVIKLLLDAGADPTARSSCNNFKDLTPVEVAMWKKQASHEGSSMISTYQSTIELLESAPLRPSTSTIGVSEVSNTEHDMETPVADETKTKAQHDILGTDLSEYAVRDLNLEAERSTKAQNTKKREFSGEGSVSSRTRSRTQTVS
ncbi:hypothetical protein AbraIFM66950_006487 [Aspergillus brasiliensis]|nr:hypothetical protein AbraIFM66950_006487 [Aspergillus brasiliensis]